MASRPITLTERDLIWSALATESVATVAQRFNRHPRTIGQLRTERRRLGLPLPLAMGRQNARLVVVARSARRNGG